MLLQLRSNQIILLVPCKTCRYLSRTNDGDDTLIYHKLTLVCCYHTTKSYETNRISHESRGLKLGYFFGNSDFVLRTTDQSDLICRTGGILLPWIKSPSSSTRRRINATWHRKIHRSEIPQRFIQNRQYSSQILALPFQGFILLHKGFSQSLVIDIGNQYIINTLYSLIEEI